MNRVIFIAICLLFFGCKNEKPVQTIPYVYVDIQINLSNIEYQPLQQNGGFVYVAGGSEGIIVYRESATKYRAIERNCSYEPTGNCARVSVDNSLLYIQCECCNSQFDFDGSVITAPATRPLKLYNTELSGNFLYITN